MIGPLELPAWEEVVRLLTLRDYNTRVVLLGTMLLGAASGLAGTFLLLRKRSLLSDAVSHATLPGVAIAFLFMVLLGGSGKSLPGLLLGAAVTGTIGMLTVLGIRRFTRLKDDAAMGVVLSVFFGVGVAILGMIQDLPGQSAAGLEAFIYGKTASMVMSDFFLISGVAVVVLVASIILLKEFTLLCFDEAFGRSVGWPTQTLDLLMLGLVTLVTVVGLQAVGLILIIAFLITPAAAARFWTNDLRRMLVIAGLVGGSSGWLGSSLSALMPGLPAGAVIVLVAALLFLFSLLFGAARGVLPRLRKHFRLKRKIGRQHLLRAVYEIQEGHCAEEGSLPANVPVPMGELAKRRSWTPGQLHRLIRLAGREDHIDFFDGATLRLSEAGFGEASRITRNHRLWEIFLITHAEIAASHVDRDADSVEHILSPGMVRELERQLADREIGVWGVPVSPHPLAGEGGG